MMGLLINAIRLVQMVIFIRVLMTWVMPGRVPGALQVVTNPIDKLLKVFQVLIPAGPAYIDLGPMLCLLLLEVIQRVLISAMYSGALGGF